MVLLEILFNLVLFITLVHSLPSYNPGKLSRSKTFSRSTSNAAKALTRTGSNAGKSIGKYFSRMPSRWKAAGQDERRIRYEPHSSGGDWREKNRQAW